MRLTTKNLTVSGVREDETTFPNLIVDEIAKTLEAAGFEISKQTTDSGFRRIEISWNGKRRFMVGAQSESNTGYANIRVANCYGQPWDSWGSTFRFAGVSSTSETVQSVSFTVNFFASGDTVYLKFSGTTDTTYSNYSVAGYDEDGNYSVINIREMSRFFPAAETDMDNNWASNLAAIGHHPYAAGKCYVRSGFAFYNTGGGKAWYFTDDLFAVSTNATFSIGQLCVIDGQKYINLASGYFAKWCDDG